MDLDLDLDSIFNGFGSGFGFKCVLGLDWILDLKKFMDLDLDLDLFLDMDSNPNPRIQIRTSLVVASIFSRLTSDVMLLLFYCTGAVSANISASL